ncbi:MAG: adenylate/guanylate cyclase domain-containing protein [Acidimicrobiia bacterium]
MEAPETRYAKSGDLYIAYEVVGDAPIDVVHVPGNLFTLEAGHEEPLAGFHRWLERFARCVVFDKRGTGLSDRLPPDVTPTIEERTDDIRAVMDAAGIERAALVGIADGGPVALFFAATYPERTTAIVLSATAARMTWAPDYPWARTPDQIAGFLESVENEWGTGIMRGYVASIVDEQLVGRYERLAATPSAAARLYRAYFRTDVRDVLGAITAPTLIVHNEEHPTWPIEGARYLGEHLPTARLIELPGPPSRDSVQTLKELIEEFLTGRRPDPEVDRVLKTVMFTDIVGSTDHAVQLGDQRWASLLNDHDRAIRHELERFRGNEIKTTGDGFLAAFDGPARAIRCAQAIAGDAQDLGLEVRAGLHTGECELRGDDLAGIAVHIGARVASLAGPGEVLVTSTVRDLVAGSGIEFADRGRHALKGVPGEWQVLAVQA